MHKVDIPSNDVAFHWRLFFGWLRGMYSSWLMTRTLQAEGQHLESY